ncbi:hypothetical protein IQ07DRAFT_405056 [Pyrenochaeta sp. DS3sAY3a]|nr:hypothetical protein IQ07DRAFT_405056 [Pyrenochaeta sp. DS3sAY3a]
MNIQAPTFNALSKAQKRALILRDELRYTDPRHLDTFIGGITDDEPPTYRLVNGRVQPELTLVTLNEKAKRFDLGNVHFPDENNDVRRVFLTVEKGRFEWRPAPGLPVDEADLNSLPIHAFIARGMIPLFQSKYEAIVDRQKKINSARGVAHNMSYQPKARYYNGESIAQLGKRSAEVETSSGVNNSKKQKLATPVPKHISNKHNCVALDTIPIPKKIETLNSIPEETKIALFDTIVKTAFPNFDSLMTASWNVVSIYKECGGEDTDLHEAVGDLERVLHAFENAFRKREGTSTNAPRREQDKVVPRENKGGPSRPPVPAPTQKRTMTTAVVTKPPIQAPPQEERRQTVLNVTKEGSSKTPVLAATPKCGVARVVVQKPSSQVAAPRKDSVAGKCAGDSEDDVKIVEARPRATTIIQRIEESKKDKGKARVSEESDLSSAITWETSPEATPRPITTKQDKKNVPIAKEKSGHRLQHQEKGQVQHDQLSKGRTQPQGSLTWKSDTTLGQVTRRRNEHHQMDGFAKKDSLKDGLQGLVESLPISRTGQRQEVEQQQKQHQLVATTSTTSPRPQNESNSATELPSPPKTTINWGQSSLQPKSRWSRPSLSPITPPSGAVPKIHLPPPQKRPVSAESHPPTAQSSTTMTCSMPTPILTTIPKARPDSSTVSPEPSPCLPGHFPTLANTTTVDMTDKTPSPGIAPVARMMHNRSQWENAEIIE